MRPNCDRHRKGLLAETLIPQDFTAGYNRFPAYTEVNDINP